MTAIPESEEKSRFNNDKWFDLLNLDFEIGHYCCQEMKKKPLTQLCKFPFIATRAEESDMRTQAWIRTGCNAFGDKHGKSQPLSFWTEQDVLHYIKKYNLEVPSVYGELKYKGVGGMLYDFTLDGTGDLQFTGCQRTGCIFCGFGCHHDDRFVMLKQTHPKQYDYCMGGGAYDENGVWKPNEKGLGMAHCIDELNKLYSKNGKKFIKY